jgi:hypothetical protein
MTGSSTTLPVSGGSIGRTSAVSLPSARWGRQKMVVLGDESPKQSPEITLVLHDHVVEKPSA